MASYQPKTQEAILALLVALDAGYEVCAWEWAKFTHGKRMEREEYEHICALPDPEGEITKIFDALDAPGGMPELPFTDLVRSSDGRECILGELRRFDWTLKMTDAPDGFLLGDTGVLFDYGSLPTGMRVPLCRASALYLSPSERPNSSIGATVAHRYEVDAMNLESAARARRWIVGEPHTLEQMRSQRAHRPMPETMDRAAGRRDGGGSSR